MMIALSPSTRIKSGMIPHPWKGGVFGRAAGPPQAPPSHRAASRAGSRRLGDVERIDHIETRVGAPDGVLEADQQQARLGRALGDVESIQGDARFVVENRVR